MKIGIDARWIFREMSGIGVYTRELIRHLAQIDRQNQYILFFSDQDVMRSVQNELDSVPAGNFSTILLDFGVFSLRNQLRMSFVIKAHQLQIFHSTNYMIPLYPFPRHRRGKIACVINIHDLIPMIFPKATPRALKTRFFPLYRWLMKEVTARSNLIITGSKSSLNDIINLLHCRPERIVTIPDGVAVRFHPAKTDILPSQDPRLLRRNKIILWVGRQDPYKNLAGLIEAFALLRKNYQGEVKLRLVGPGDSRYPEPLKRINKLGIMEAVKWTGHISEAELLSEYQNANMLVMPSLYEGFGLPALEAMACGTPVICSNRGSLPEVCGQAALQIDPEDISGICDAMHRVLTDARLAGSLAARGPQQAAKFKWQATAKKTILAYKQAAQ